MGKSTDILKNILVLFNKVCLDVRNKWLRVDVKENKEITWCLCWENDTEERISWCQKHSIQGIKEQKTLLIIHSRSYLNNMDETKVKEIPINKNWN